MGKIEDILHTTYERKTKGHGSDIEEFSPFQILISVEPITPCATMTIIEEYHVNHQVISGRGIFIERGSIGSSSRILSSKRTNQFSTPYGGVSSASFTMAGVDPTIRLPMFQCEGSKDPKKNLFICENILATKKVIDEDMKVAYFEITFKYYALDWYMVLAVNNLTRVPKIVEEVKRKLINEF
jgi:hypothetical protein